MGARRRILLAEDEFLVLEVTREDLEDAGYEVVAASTGDEALRVLEQDPEFDLLFTDIRMPGSIDGWQLGRHARALRPGLKVIYASGYTDGIASLGPDEAFVHKPYRWSEVARALAGLGLAGSAGNGNPCHSLGPSA